MNGIFYLLSPIRHRQRETVCGKQRKLEHVTFAVRSYSELYGNRKRKPLKGQQKAEVKPVGNGLV